MATPSGQLACPHCGRRFHFKPKLAGRAVKCTCGGGFRVPATAEGEAEPIGAGPSTPAPAAGRESAAPDRKPRRTDTAGEVEPDDTYALNTDAPDDAAGQVSADVAPQHDGKCPNCNQAIKPNAVLCVKCGFNLQEGRKLQTEVAADAGGQRSPEGEAAVADAASTVPAGVASTGGDPGDPRNALASVGATSVGHAAAVDTARRQHIIDVYVPGVLIALGVLMHFVNSYYFTADAGASLIDAVASTVFRVIVWVPLAFLGMLLAVKILDVAFGTLGMAIYKLIGIALGPGAAWSIISYLLPGVGWFVGFFVAIGLYFGLLKMLFDLDGWEAIMLIVIIFILQAVAMLLGVTMLTAILMGL